MPFSTLLDIAVAMEDVLSSHGTYVLVLNISLTYLIKKQTTKKQNHRITEP